VIWRDVAVGEGAAAGVDLGVEAAADQIADSGVVTVGQRGLRRPDGAELGEPDLPRRTMAIPQTEPSAQALGESLAALAVQVAALRGQVAQVKQRLDQAGLRRGLDLAARFEELAQTVADALDAAAPRGPAAPYWIGLDRQAFGARLTDLRRWADTVLRQHYSGYELRDCWPSKAAALGAVNWAKRPGLVDGPCYGMG
jgi:hypothetical protein